MAVAGSIKMFIGKRVLVLLLCSGAYAFVLDLNAQDAHFSIQSISTAILNPAKVGNSSRYRANMQYRSQWKALGTPFTTTSASFDMSMKKSEKKSGGYFGFGLNALKDKLGNDGYQATSVHAAVAYHLPLNDKNTLRLGFSTSFEQRAVGFSNGKWGSQFDGFQYDPNIASGEVFGGENQSSLDLGSGISYSFIKAPKKRKHKIPTRIEAGIAGFHLGSIPLNTPDGLTAEIPTRFSGYITGVFSISEHMAIGPSAFFHTQGGLSNQMVGANAVYLINSGDAFISHAKRTALSLGAYLRLNDAIVISPMFEWSDFAVGMAYDLNISALNEYTSGRGSFELAFRWKSNGGRKR